MEKDLKILGYANLSKLDDMMDRHFVSTLHAVSDEVTQSPKDIAELNEYIERGEFTHVLIPDEHFHQLEGSLTNCNIPVVEFLQDHWIPWAVDKKKKYILDNGINHTVTFNPRFLEPYAEISNLYPSAIGYNDEIFQDDGLERKIDILMSGATRTHEPWVYPVRNWLAEVLPKIGIKEGLNIHQQKHPGYFPGKENNCEEDYSNLLNQAKIATGGSSHWRLPLKKFYEIPASGTILLSDLPVEDADFFRNRIIEIDPEKINSKKYENQLRRGIMEVLNNYEKFKEELQPFRTKGDRLSRGYSGRASDIRKILKTIK